MKSKNFTSAYVGKFGERLCAKHLKKAGYKILGRNRRIGKLEADIIAANKTHLIFTEVKTRRTDLKNSSRPASAVDRDKRENLIVFARSYVKTLSKKYAEKQIRIDVCEITVYSNGKKLKLNEINYIENAISR